MLLQVFVHVLKQDLLCYCHQSRNFNCSRYCRRQIMQIGGGTVFRHSELPSKLFTFTSINLLIDLIHEELLKSGNERVLWNQIQTSHKGMTFYSLRYESEVLILNTLDLEFILESLSNYQIIIWLQIREWNKSLPSYCNYEKICKYV